MMLLGKQFLVNDTLERMYPVLSGIKRADRLYTIREFQEEMAKDAMGEKLEEVAKALYNLWVQMNHKVCYAQFKALMQAEQWPFIRMATEAIRVLDKIEEEKR